MEALNDEVKGDNAKESDEDWRKRICKETIIDMPADNVRIKEHAARVRRILADWDKAVKE